jgi:atypical dual specificity phosphatase
MYLNQRNDGVWISEAPIRSWINEESSPLTDQFVPIDDIPFISQLELETLSEAQRTTLSELDLRSLYPIGIAYKGGNCYYLIFIWNAGYLFRKKAKLSSNTLFYSLLTDESNAICPNIDQLLRPLDIEKYDAQVLDHLSFALLHSGRLDLALQSAISLCEKTPETEKGWLRLGDISFKMESFKLAMLAYGRLLHVPTSQKLFTYCIERSTLCSIHTEWGHVFLEEELEQIPASLSSVLLEPWVDARDMLKNTYKRDGCPMLRQDRHARVLAPSGTGGSAPLPAFFRWIVPFQIAVSSAPHSEAEIERLYSPFVGIRHIISLDDQSSPETAWFYGKSIKHTTIPISDFFPPSIEQVDYIIELLVDPSNLPTLIHCTAGLGRTGTVTACYLTAFGFQIPGEDGQMPVMQASEAISAIRAIRPGSIETVAQEELVSKWASEVWKRKSILRPAVQEPSPCALELIGNVPVNADLLVLVGLQGNLPIW